MPTDAIVTEGSEKGELLRVCANPDCPVHHAKKQTHGADAAFKAEQEKRRRGEAMAQATGLRVLCAIATAVLVRLKKRDLMFVAERLAAMLDDKRQAIVIRQHGTGKTKSSAADGSAKLLTAFVHKSDESILGRLLIEMAILLAVRDSGKVLKEAAALYKVDVDAIAAKVKQEFAAKDTAKTTKKNAPKPPSKTTKRPTAA